MSFREREADPSTRWWVWVRPNPLSHNLLTKDQGPGHVSPPIGIRSIDKSTETTRGSRPGYLDVGDCLTQRAPSQKLTSFPNEAQMC